jgi:carbonic anhydrase
VFVQEAWARGQDLRVHGWVYSLANGLVTDLDVTIDRLDYQRKLAPHPELKTDAKRLD